MIVAVMKRFTLRLLTLLVIFSAFTIFYPPQSVSAFDLQSCKAKAAKSNGRMTEADCKSIDAICRHGLSADGECAKKKEKFADILNSSNEEGGTPQPGQPGSQTPRSEDPSVKCHATGSPFSWILCPAVNILNDVLNWVYSNVIENFSKIDPQVFQTNSGAFQAWKIFRDLGNVLFIIVFLAVIVSQLTGIGIDNYGIKKILPRLIAIAILINISFFVAQLAVDASNILGASIRNLLSEIVKLQESSANVHAGLGANAAALVGLGAVIATIIVNPGALLGGVLMLISALGGLLTLFVLLIIRQVIAVSLVVLSPIAIVLYALPNTQNFFKKFKTIAIAILMFYPLAGLMMGAGDLTAKIMVQVSQPAPTAEGEGATPNPIYAIAAVVVQTMPFFALPGLLRSSVNGIGNIGNLTQRGIGGVTARARNRVENSQGFKALRAKINTAGMTDENGNQTLLGRIRSSRPLRHTTARNLKEAQDVELARLQAEELTNPAVYQDRLQAARTQQQTNIQLAQQRMASPDYYDTQRQIQVAQGQEATNPDVLRDRLAAAQTQSEVNIDLARQRQAMPDYYDAQRQLQLNKGQLDIQSAQLVINHPEVLAERLASAQNKNDSEVVSARNTQLLQGTFTITGNAYDAGSGTVRSQTVNITDHTNKAEMQRALEIALSNKDQSSVRALSSIMAKKGMSDNIINAYDTVNSKHGIDMKHASMNSVRNAMAESLLDGQVKEENRDLFEWAKANTTATANGTLSDYSVSSAGKISADAAAKLDAEAIARMQKQVEAEIRKNATIVNGRVDVSGLSKTAQDAIRNLQNIGKDFTATDDAGKRLRQRAKPGTQNAINQVASSTLINNVVGLPPP